MKVLERDPYLFFCSLKCHEYFIEQVEKMNDRFICTKENPWSKEKSERAEHPDAILNNSTDYFDVYECPNCKLFFKVELPE